MSNITDEIEQDVELKKKLMRYLWNLGYIPRKNVYLIENWEGGNQFTDIDVIGIKIDEELNTDFVVCDCKSGVRAKTGERLFWLCGVMRYFGAQRGIFLRKQLLNQKFIDLANSLNISPLSEKMILQIQKSYGLTSFDMVGSFSSYSNKAENVFSLLRQFEPKVVNYILGGYWEDFPKNQIATLIKSCTLVKENTGFEDNAKSFLITYILSLLSLAVLRFSRDIIMVPNEIKQETIELGLIGGRLMAEERKNFSRIFMPL